ncbi:MAG: hypothetical protein AB8D78_14630 [Akkermansiaceae bacterium]
MRNPKILWLIGVACALTAVLGVGLMDLVTIGDLPRNRSDDAHKPPSIDKASEWVRTAIQNGTTIDSSNQWQAIKNFSQPEIEAAVAELEPHDHSELPYDILGMLFYRWGLLDPVSANQKAAEMFPKRFAGAREAVLTAWINQGGAADAWDAVKDEREIWACTRSVPGAVAEMLVSSWHPLDDATAFHEVQKLNDENSFVADHLCSHRGKTAWKTADARRSFLSAAATHPDPYVIGSAREKLFRQWAKANPDAARKGAMNLGITAEEKESLISWIEMEVRDAHEKIRDPIPSLSQSSGHAENNPWRKVLADLLDNWQSSPSVYFDYDLREKSQKVLKQIKVEDLATWVLEHISDDSIDENRDSASRLRDLVVLELTKRDGHQLVESLIKNPPKHAEDLIEEAVWHWTQHEPLAVLEWLDTNPALKGQDSLTYYKDDALLKLASHSPNEFKKRLSTMDEEARQEILEQLD